MGRARDNSQSDRPKDEILHDYEARLRFKCLRALMKADAPNRVVEEFEALLADPLLNRRTRAQIARSYGSYLKSMLPQSPQVQVDARQQSMSMADLLAMASEAPNKGALPNEETAPGFPAPNERKQSDSRPAQPEISEESDSSRDHQADA